MKHPLAQELRPESLEDFFGQAHLLEKDKILWDILNSRTPVSMVFWGPPGCGKTTLARICSKIFKLPFIEISAVVMGIPEVRKLIAKAQDEFEMFNTPTILFIDEIHRFNKAQQDAFLPHVEKGTIIIIGATTENPSFSLNNALLSRLKVIQFQPLSKEHLQKILQKAKDKFGFSYEDDSDRLIAEYANGDARKVLNTLELFLKKGSFTIQKHELQKVLSGEVNVKYDRNGDYHFDLISALHKSLRGSDPDAAVYYMMRMLEGGEDPLYIVRRMIRFASEDIGLADPHALTLAISTLETVRFLGMPEADTSLVSLAVYLALAPKSNSSYIFSKTMKRVVKERGDLPVPLSMRNAPTSVMKELGYSEGYKYDHDFDGGMAFQQHLPDDLRGQTWYKPGSRGFEKKLKMRHEKIYRRRKKES